MEHSYTGPFKLNNGDVMRWSHASTGLLAILIAFIVAPACSGQGPLLLVKSDSYVSIGENLAREKVILGYVVSQSPENIPQDNLRIRGAVSSVSVYDSEGGLSFSVDYLENGWSLIGYSLRDTTLKAGDRSEVTIEFTKTVENLGGNRVYKIQYRWSMPPTSYQVIAKLPKGSSLKSTSENPSEFYRKNGSQYMRYSGYMMSSFQTHIVFTPPLEEQVPEGEQVPGEWQQVEEKMLLPYVVLAIAAVVCVFALWAIRRTRAVKPPMKVPRRVPEAMPRPDVEKILRMLHENERKVVEELIREDNLTQATLCGRTGIPKSTMSRILAGLEHKGVVRRVGYGMSKKVMLTEWARGWKEREG